MNIAFTSLILFLLFLPGVLYRQFYFYGDFSKQFIKSSITEEVIFSLIPSIVFQVIWIGISKLINQNIDFKIIGVLINGSPEQALIPAFQNIQDNFSFILLYFGTIYLFSAFSGFAIRVLIAKRKFDIVFSVLSYKNTWHYIFKGNYIDQLRFRTKFYSRRKRFIAAAFGSKDLIIQRNVDLVILDILVVIDKPIIYRGFAEDFYLDKDGGLDRIVIKYPQRFYISDINGSKISDDSIVEIEGDFLIIPYKEVKNLNFSYIYIEDDPEISETNGYIKVSADFSDKDQKLKNI